MAKRKASSRGKSRGKGKSNAPRIAPWFAPGLFALVLLFVAELALLLPPTWAPEPVEAMLAKLQATVTVPYPGAAESADPETLRKQHEKRMAQIESDGERDLEKVRQQIENLRRENETLRGTATPQSASHEQATEQTPGN